MKNKLIQAAMICGLALIAACTDSALEQSYDVSLEKAFECAKSAGIKGQLPIQTSIGNGQVNHSIMPTNGVTQAQADKANRCIAS